jgi:hypothetical protein
MLPLATAWEGTLGKALLGRPSGRLESIGLDQAERWRAHVPCDDELAVLHEGARMTRSSPTSEKLIRRIASIEQILCLFGTGYWQIRSI